MTDSKSIYTVGGTVQASGGLYIQRAADHELLELCRAGELAFILSSRQVGKSSLMVRTAEELKKENVRSVIIDLSAIGVNVTPDEWYLGILNEIANTLELKTDIFAWWDKFGGLSPAQRLVNFFRDVLLKEVPQRIVFFFDEIDTTLSIPFSDDFFTTLRAIYNARSTTPEFARSSFVLIGVATPSDLISDSKRTPFNIGRRVELSDFTREEAKPLAYGLGENAEQVLGWVFDWTSGHPYLTQRLCAYLAKSENHITEKAVSQAVETLFIGEGGQGDNNLQFVRDMLTRRAPDTVRVLRVYKNIRGGRKVVDDEHSIIKAHLKLSGVVRSKDDNLQVRNRIYHNVFNLPWIQDVTPKNLAKTAAIFFAIVAFVLLSIFTYDFIVGTMSSQYTGNFYTTRIPSEKLKILSRIFDLEGILQNTDYDFRARELFYSLTWDEQVALFKNIDLSDKQRDLPVVIRGLYVTFANIEGGQDSSELLRIMENSLDDLNTPELKTELELWLEARDAENNGTNQIAFDKYSEAIQQNPDNPATRYERARISLKMGLYEQALQDLDATMALAHNLSTESFEQEIATPTEWPTKYAPELFQETRTPIPSPNSTLTPSPIFNEITLTPLPIAKTPTSKPITPENRDGYKSSFYSIAYIRSAIARAMQEYTGIVDFELTINNNFDEFSNLESAGLINPSRSNIANATGTSMVQQNSSVPSSTITFTPPPEIPMDPVEFVTFYFENINKGNYDLTWSLLSDQFKAKSNPDGQGPYMDVWNTIGEVVIYSTEYTQISDTSAIVVIESNINSTPLYYYLVWDNSRNTWLIDPMPESFDVSCNNAPKFLSVGIKAEVVTSSDDLLLRNAPTDGAVIERMPPGTKVDVIDGPECKYYLAQSRFFWWWQVQPPSGNQGWVVEGSDSIDPVFIQPAFIVQ